MSEKLAANDNVELNAPDPEDFHSAITYWRQHTDNLVTSTIIAENAFLSVDEYSELILQIVIQTVEDGKLVTIAGLIRDLDEVEHEIKNHLHSV